MSTSLTWSVGRVSLLLHCSVPSSTLPRHPPRRELSCTCTILPGFSTLRSGAESRRKSTEFVAQVSGSQRSKVEPLGKFNVERTGVQSVLSLVVVLAMTFGVQGAPSSQDTFEDVPQTLSGEHLIVDKTWQNFRCCELVSDSVETVLMRCKSLSWDLNCCKYLGWKFWTPNSRMATECIVWRLWPLAILEVLFLSTSLSSMSVAPKGQPLLYA